MVEIDVFDICVVVSFDAEAEILVWGIIVFLVGGVLGWFLGVVKIVVILVYILMLIILFGVGFVVYVILIEVNFILDCCIILLLRVF